MNILLIFAGITLFIILPLVFAHLKDKQQTSNGPPNYKRKSADTMYWKW